ncbi:MAG: hypothetical protein AB8C46_23295 [Burkholderiaceae bacterium]
MTTASVNAGSLRIPSRRALNTSLFAAEPLFAASGYLLALSLLVTVAAMGLDARLFQGENIWIKPIKFQVALTVYLLTLAFFARYLPPGMTGRLSYRIYATVVVFTIVGEMLWIGGAAMFGVASHFNQSSPLMAFLYPLMGVFAVTLTSATLVYGIAIWRYRQSELNPALRLSIALGLCLTFLLTVPVASTLSSSTSHFVGVPVTGATMPIMGWSREVGDLRIAHFLATHAMHFVPLLGLLATWLLSRQAATRAVWGLSLAFVGLVAFTFGQALSGLPLIPLP